MMPRSRCTRKTYRAIAEILFKYNTREAIAYAMASWFQRDSSSFDRTKFLEACGVEVKG